MSPRWWKGSFRRKLLVTYLLLGLVPALALTLFDLYYLTGSIQLWKNPGIEQLLGSSLVLAREFLATVEAGATAFAHRVAADGELRASLAAQDREMAGKRLGEILERERLEARGSLPFVIILAPPGTAAEGSQKADAALRDRGWTMAGLAPEPSPTWRLPAPGATAFAADAGVAACRLPVGRVEDHPGWEVVAGWQLAAATASRARAMTEGLPLYQSLGAYKRVRLRLLWAVTGGFFLVVVVSSWMVARFLAANLSRPIFRLVEGTRRVAGGDYDHRVAVDTHDELGRLVEAFNRMTGDLKEQAERLRRAERIGAWQEVARGVAHQIKNPLTPIQLSIHRLRAIGAAAGSKERDLLEECLGAMSAEVENLRRIADEFSRFARLPEPVLRPVRLDSLLREVAELYLAGHPEIRLKLVLDSSLPSVSLDPELTRQAVSNLIKNAIEAMPAGGELIVALAPLIGNAEEETRRASGARWLRITIADSGGGIPAEVRENLFVPYLTTKQGGTGLGLALAYRMVVDQGGKISVLTEEGRGTSFHLDFPFVPGSANGRGSLADGRPGSRA